VCVQLGPSGIFAPTGLSYWFDPDPIRGLQRQVQQEGRSITQEDLLRIVLHASRTLSTPRAGESRKTHLRLLNFAPTSNEIFIESILDPFKIHFPAFFTNNFTTSSAI